jgi:hypothetical protein
VSEQVGPTTNRKQLFGFLRDQSHDGLFKWILLMSLICFAAVILWDYGFIGYMFENDPSRVSALIIGVFAAFSLYCVYAIFDGSKELRSLEIISSELEQGAHVTRGAEQVEVGRVTLSVDRPLGAFLHDATLKIRQAGDNRLDVLLQSFAAQMRKTGRLGIFVSDVLYKMGMLGTVIGFIAMLVSMRDLGEFDVETMRLALQQMTGGMAIALLTTITGLVCGVLLRLQFNILETLSQRIVHRTVRISELFLSPQVALSD